VEKDLLINSLNPGRQKSDGRGLRVYSPGVQRDWLGVMIVGLWEGIDSSVM
jgi:hypothetical protein